ncbi:hypothetical protein HDU85_004263 [Gaertneriomyces sp. JEL0708]|nr:hypothetical protein HDU85_004263 [Gaertneriomyces sp. JEL0708]
MEAAGYYPPSKGSLHVPHYHVHRDYMRSLWIVPTVLLGLYALTLLSYFAVTVAFESVLSVKAALKARAEQLVRSVPGASRVAPGSVTQTEEIEEEHVQIVAGPGGEEEEAGDQETPSSIWQRRCDRAARSARTAFTLSLVIATIASLPIEYRCRGADFPTNPIPPACHTCLTNASTLGMAVVGWIFMALSIAWVALDLFMHHVSTAAMNQLVMTLVAEPLVVIAFVIFIRTWRDHKSQSC